MTINDISVGFAHIGLGKTGSTFLQKHYFSNLPLNYYSTQPPFDWPPSLQFVTEGNSFWYKDLLNGRAYLSRSERARRYALATNHRLQQWQNDARSFSIMQEGKGPWLLSSEGLCGLSAQTNALHMSLLKIAGIKKVIFVCRQQANYVKSLWRQLLLAEDRFARFVQFETLFGNSFQEGIFDLDWNFYIQAMDTEFGAENVLILPYELLVTDAASFFQRLNKFFGFTENFFIPNLNAKENPSRSDASYHGLTIDNHFPFNYLPRVRRKLHFLSNQYPRILSFIHAKHQLSVNEKVIIDLQQRFAIANQRLEMRIDKINLRDYGYY